MEFTKIMIDEIMAAVEVNKEEIGQLYDMDTNTYKQLDADERLELVKKMNYSLSNFHCYVGDFGEGDFVLCFMLSCLDDSDTIIKDVEDRLVDGKHKIVLTAYSFLDEEIKYNIEASEYFFEELPLLRNKGIVTQMSTADISNLEQI